MYDMRAGIGRKTQTKKRDRQASNECLGLIIYVARKVGNIHCT